MPLDHQILEAREEADRLGQRLEAAVADLRPVTGADRSGTVRAHLDARGSVEEVRVEGRWVEALAGDDLGPAVLEAIAEAGTLRTQAWAEAFDREESKPTPTTRPLPHADWAARIQTGAGGEVDADAMARALTSLGTLGELIDDLEQQVATAMAVEHLGRSKSGRVSAHAQITGAVLDVSIDRRWVVHAHAANLSREITEACRRAILTATASGLEILTTQSRLGRLQALMQDPDAFAQALRENTY